ncbi:MAG: metallophosphoesterase [Nocardioides sp.]
MLRIAHFSDTHFGWRSSSPGRVRRILDHIAAMDPPADVVLLSGDVADHGTPEEYAEAGSVLADWAGPAPLLVLPGNHDNRAEFGRWLGLPDEGRPLHQAVEVGGALFLLLDSMVPAVTERIDHGELDAQSLEWLDARLRERPAGQAAFVCLHHPPVEVGQPAMDAIRLREPDAKGFAEVLARHPNVVAVLCGHIHSACATQCAGLPMLAGGGAASTVTLEEEDLPFITATLPPTFALHLVGDDLRIVTHWRAV